MGMIGSVGKAALNFAGRNLLGVDFEREKQLAEQRRQKQAMIDSLIGRLSPGYQSGPDFKIAAPGSGEQSQTEYTPPVRTQDPLNANSPDLAKLMFGASQFGIKTDGLMEALKAQQPHITTMPDGTAINDKNGTYEGRVFPKLGEGIIPMRNASGQLTGAQDIPNYAESVAKIAGATKGAEAKAQSPYDFISVPGPNGQPRVMAKSQAVNGVFEGQSPADATYGNSMATAAADQYKGLQTAGQQAAAKISRYKQIDGLLGNYEGGKFSPAGLEIASALNSLGFKMDPKMQNAQAAAALGNQLVLDLNGGSLGTGFSNADRTFLEKTIPGLQQSAGGRKQLIQIGVASAQRQQDVANKARQWQQRFGRIDAPDATGKTFQDYLDAWSNQHPLFGQQ